MSSPRRLLLLAVVVVVAASACSSGEEPAPTLTTNRPLVTLPPPGPAPPPGVPITLAPPLLTPTTTTPDDEPKPGVERFVPTLPLADGVFSLEVIFVDGSRSAVEWPADLDLVSQGLIPYGWAFITGGSSRDFFVRPGAVQDVLTLLGGAELVGEYPDANGAMVGLWRPENDEVDYLGFQFGSWTVLVYDYRDALAMSEEHRALWATNFHGEVADDGFLVLSADRPMYLVFAGDYPAPLNMTLRGVDGEVKLTPGECTTGMIDGIDANAFLVWCTEEANMTVQAYGTQDFQQAVSDGLFIRSVEIALPPEPPDPEEEEEE